MTEVPFEPPAQALEPHDLLIRQHGAVLPLELERPFLRTAIRQGLGRQLLGGDRLLGDLAVPHLVAIGVHQAGDQGLTEAEASLDG